MLNDIVYFRTVRKPQAHSNVKIVFLMLLCNCNLSIYPSVTSFITFGFYSFCFLSKTNIVTITESLRKRKCSSRSMHRVPLGITCNFFALKLFDQFCVETQHHHNLCYLIQTQINDNDSEMQPVVRDPTLLDRMADTAYTTILVPVPLPRAEVHSQECRRSEY